MKHIRDAFIKACRNCSLKRTRGPFRTYMASNEDLAFYLDFQMMRSGDMWDVNIGINRIEFVDDNMSAPDSEIFMRFQGLVDIRSLEIDIFFIVKSDDEKIFHYCIEVFEDKLIRPLTNLKSIEDLAEFVKLNPRHMMRKELRSFLSNFN